MILAQVPALPLPLPQRQWAHTSHKTPTRSWRTTAVPDPFCNADVSFVMAMALVRITRIKWTSSRQQSSSMPSAGSM